MNRYDISYCAIICNHYILLYHMIRGSLCPFKFLHRGHGGGRSTTQGGIGGQRGEGQTAVSWMDVYGVDSDF